MSDKLVRLFGSTAPVNGAEPAVIEYLKDALAAAERGEIVAVGIIKIDPAGCIDCGYRNPSLQYDHHIVAGCSYLQHDIAETTTIDRPIVPREPA